MDSFASFGFAARKKTSPRSRGEPSPSSGSHPSPVTKPVATTRLSSVSCTTTPSNPSPTSTRNRHKHQRTPTHASVKPAQAGSSTRVLGVNRQAKFKHEIVLHVRCRVREVRAQPSPPGMRVRPGGLRAADSHRRPALGRWCWHCQPRPTARETCC